MEEQKNENLPEEVQAENSTEEDTGNRKRLPEDGYYSGDWQESIFCIQDLVCAKVLSMVKKEVRWDL